MKDQSNGGLNEFKTMAGPRDIIMENEQKIETTTKIIQLPGEKRIIIHRDTNKLKMVSKR